MRYHFSNEQLSDFQSNIKKEWVMTNGLGGYCGTSVLGALGRTHQGYLIASLHPPVERYVVFSKTAESVFQDNIRYELEILPSHPAMFRMHTNRKIPSL